VIVLNASCLQVATTTCENGGVCPKGLRCADTGDDRICILLSCGNGRDDDGESCDDGNTRSGDGCPADCTAPCGDGVRDPQEACDDRNRVDGDGCSADCRALDGFFSVSPTMVTFSAVEGEAPPAAAVVTVRLELRGDSVLFGYAPDFSQPSWLTVVQESSIDNNVNFKLQITDTTVVGEMSTKLRFMISHESATGSKSFDLQVLYSVSPSDLLVQVAPGELSFVAAASGAPPLAQAVSLTFNGENTSVQSVPSWVAVTSISESSRSPASYVVSVTNTAFAPGTVLVDNIVFSTIRETFHRKIAVRVTFNVAAFLPELRFVAPHVGVAGRAGTLRLRGQGFPVGAPFAVRVGTLDIGPLIPDSDSQITLSYPPLPAGNYPVSSPSGIAPMQPTLTIVATPPMVYQAMDSTGTRTRLIYDAERQAVYGMNRQHEQIDHFVYADGSWSRVPSHVIPDLTDIAMMPNGRALIALDSDTISEISLLDGQFRRERRVNNPEPFCGGFFDKAVPANNGKMFVIFGLAECFGFTPAYLYDTLDRSLVAVASLNRAAAGASGDGSRIYAGTSFMSVPEPVMIFDSLSNSMSTGNAEFNLEWVSVSDDASRVILQNTHVYDRSLVLTGRLPPRGVSLASRDSSKAFLYVDDVAAPRLEIYDLNGPLQAGALYPLLRTVMLPDSANGSGTSHPPVAMTSSVDDAVVFVAGDSRMLVVPVN
jgi:cysteine-rich repeat protein